MMAARSGTAWTTPIVGDKMLIQQLREIEAGGIVHRDAFHEVPPGSNIR